MNTNPITSPQRNIWLTEKLNEGSSMNILFGTFTMPKRLDLDLLKKAINKMIEINEGLRIQVFMEEGELRQQVVRYQEEEIKSYKLEKDDELEKLVKKIQKEPLCFIKHKLYDFQIIQTNEKIIVCVKLHHIIGDAWTMMQTVEQMKELYIAIKENKEIQEKPSYIEYIKKEEEYKNSNKYNKDKEFWNEYVKSMECKNKFQIDRNITGQRVEKQLEKKFFARITKYCEENEISEYLFLLTLISIYYSKILDMDKIVIGTPFLNRKKSDKELEMFGMFISTLPINIEIKQEQNFLDLCKQVGKTNMNCFRHSKFPYEEIQKQYQESKNEVTNLYEIAFSYQVNKLEKEIDGEKGETIWYYSGEQSTPLIISYMNHFGEHRIYYDYLQSCFTEKEIEKTHEILIHMIGQILDKREIVVEDIQVLSNEDLTLLQKLNETGKQQEINKNIIQTWEEVVKKYPNKVALKYENIEVQYKELEKQVNKLAFLLNKHGIVKQMPVAIMFDKSIEMIVSMLAIMKVGAYYVPILPEEEEERKKYIIKDCGAEFLLTHKHYNKKMKIDNVAILEVDEIMQKEIETDTIQEPDIKPSDLCYMIYTSGTTRIAKRSNVTT